jgi:hypothetical protein
MIVVFVAKKLNRLYSIQCMKILLPILFITLLVLGCTEEPAETSRNYFSFRVDGKHYSIGPGNALTGGQFDCALLPDTALFIAVQAPGGTGGVLYAKKYTGDGTYPLGAVNKAFFHPSQSVTYKTTSVYTGTLKVKKTTIQIPGGGPMNMMEGTFSFRAVDTVTGKVVSVTEGKLSMPRSFN